ncbi:MAG: Stp1/IreP family PP2C-type Ser/Thr phosphatase [Clostridiales bacterium]|nr:Stp1/IreP family PP2C-type Ser/Thr phosphatase [Clostridiales bacterium]
MRVASRTHQGNVRASNQDALIVQPGEHGLYGVADGMGGHNAGDVASRMAALLLGRVLEGAMPSVDLLQGGIEEVNLMIYQEQTADVNLSGMGTTLTVIWEDDQEIIMGHVGDSRAYRIRNGQIALLSQDHSMVGDLMRQGLITQEEALRHPYRNVITQALGGAETIKADVEILDKRPGDKYLICSDGLYEYVSDETMLAILLRTPLEEAADMMLQLALEGGGKDNISLVIAEVTA